MSVDVFESNSTDVEEVADLFTAAAGVRATGSPAFLRLKCYRYLEHVGTNPDFEAGYRSRGGVRTLVCA
jgi:TPP-dependent pyruvate/acetoin dehydrogenase alpha subunit